MSAHLELRSRPTSREPEPEPSSFLFVSSCLAVATGRVTLGANAQDHPSLGIEASYDVVMPVDFLHGYGHLGYRTTQCTVLADQMRVEYGSFQLAVASVVLLVAQDVIRVLDGFALVKGVV